MGSMTGCYAGYADDPLAILYDSRTVKRAAAIRIHANEYGYEFGQVECRTTYARWLTRAEQWAEFGRERARDEPENLVPCPSCGAKVGDPCDEDGLALPCEARDEAVPMDPPVGWEPDESVPAFEFCKRDSEGAIRVYRCEVKP